MSEPNTPPSVEEQITQLKANRARRAAARAVELQKAELVALELEEKYSSSLGVIGRDFAIVTSAHGFAPIVLKRPTVIAMQRLGESKDGEEETVSIQLVCDNLVEPDEKTVRARFATSAGVLNKCIEAFGAMHEVKSLEASGK